MRIEQATAPTSDGGGGTRLSGVVCERGAGCLGGAVVNHGGLVLDPLAGARGVGERRSAVDDHSRLVYSEVLGDERASTAMGFWDCAQALTR